MLPYQLHQKLKQARGQNQSQNHENISSSLLLSVFRGLPFWIWDKNQHLQKAIETNQKCCFNHIIGLPVKNDKELPIFDYEQLVYDLIENNQNIWIKKARGIGVTTFIIRYLVWKILSTNEVDGKSIFIISGTREEFANYVKKRMEDLFFPRFPDIANSFDSKYTELTINKTWIKVMPTKNIKDVRGYMDIAYLFVDEADHGDNQFQQELEPAITAYEEKSKGKTIMASSANAPEGLYERIEKDPNSKYAKLILDYTYGLDKIYDRAFIEKKKLEPEFEREYMCHYLGRVGNIFSQSQIDRCVELGEKYKDLPLNDYAIHSIGVDPGFSSSPTAVVISEHLKQEHKVRILYSEQFENSNPQDIVNLVFDFCAKHWNAWVFVDGSNRAFVNLLKVAFNESLNWESSKSISPESHKVIPVNFSTDHRQLLSHLAMLISKEYLCIPKEHEDLIISLRSAWSNEYSLDKEQSSHNDLLDGLRLACKMYMLN